MWNMIIVRNHHQMKLTITNKKVIEAEKKLKNIMQLSLKIIISKIIKRIWIVLTMTLVKNLQ